MPKDRSIAVVAVVLIHILMAIVLSISRDTRREGRNDGPRTTLRFMARAAPALPRRPPEIIAVASPPRMNYRSARAETDVDTGTGNAAPTAPSVAPMAASSLNLSLPAQPFRLSERDLFARRDATAFEPTSRLNVTVEDSSFFGRYQALLKRMTCDELRRALRSSPSSADTIMASMSQRGCKM